MRSAATATIRALVFAPRAVNRTAAVVGELSSTRSCYRAPQQDAFVQLYHGRHHRGTSQEEQEIVMRTRKPRPAQTFPVMEGGGPAPREDQIAGIVQRVWADSRVYHQDVEALLTEWLGVEGCTVSDEEFALLLAKAHGEFARVATASDGETPHCPAGTLVECLYWDVQQLERNSADGGAR
jgi:hypothetical protein